MRDVWERFDALTDKYDEWFDSEGKKIFLSEGATFQMIIPVVRRPFLEIGVDTGRFANALSIEFGVDPSPNMLTSARDRGHPRCPRQPVRRFLFSPACSGASSLQRPFALYLMQRRRFGRAFGSCERVECSLPALFRLVRIGEELMLRKDAWAIPYTPGLSSKASGRCHPYSNQRGSSAKEPPQRCSSRLKVSRRWSLASRRRETMRVSLYSYARNMLADAHDDICGIVRHSRGSLQRVLGRYIDCKSFTNRTMTG